MRLKCKKVVEPRVYLHYYTLTTFGVKKGSLGYL